ncbi:MAG: PTS sugar transporter subunit IIB [Tyzzerella sp.]|uniref:PTS sugar transporter subunit IIB n=1 Tax=Candidatus Fimicola merdigallinarum TaxID=2840819 RepID=A0A9D9DZ75_9FIRM|nr:PTS sugar transporter subunit IIB [Candidatus Fimicola merdigallinarum]
MFKVRLFCAAGMSTSLMVNKMKVAAEEMGIEADILATSESKMDEETNGIDVALLGPQVRYKLAEAKKICEPKNVPVDVIPMADYGTMNGKKVLEFALKLAGK